MDSLPPGFQLDTEATAPMPAQSSNELPSGFELDEDKFGAPLEQAKAGVEGLLRGATFGGSDVAEVKSGISTPENIQGRMEANPVTSIGSQMIGGIAPIAATGGATAPAEALLGAGTTGARVAAMGLEGAAYGAGNAVTDYALGDPNLNAQKIISEIGMGAALGGGLGALSKGVEAAIPAVTSRLNKAMTGFTNKISSIPENFTGDWAQALTQGLKGTDPDVAIRKMSGTLGEIYNESKGAAKDIYENAMPSNIKSALKDMPLEAAQEKAFQVYSQLESKIGELRANPDEFSPVQVKQANQAVSDLQNGLVDAKTPYEIHTALHDFGKDISTGIKYDKLPTFSQQAVQNEMRGMNGIVRGFLKDPEVWGEQAAGHFSQVSDLYNAHATSIKNFQRDFMKSVVSNTGMKRATMDPGKVKTFFNNIQDVGQDLRNESFNTFLNSAQNLSKASENYAGYNAAQGSIADRVNKLAGEYSELKDVAKAMNNRSTGPSVLKELGGAGLAHAMGIPNPVVAGALGAVETFRAIKNPYELGSKINNIFNKVRALGKITERTGNLISSASKGIFSGSAKGAIESGAIGSYDKRVSRIKELSQDPQAMLDHLDKSTNSLYDAAPNISQGIHSTMMNGLNFLSSKIPQPGPQFPLSDDFEPSSAQKDQFNRYYDIINDPVSVLSNIQSGDVSNEQVEALQTVYPHLLQEMRTNVLQAMTPKKAQDINYDVKMALAKFLGQPLDGNMTVPSIMSNQSVFTPPQPPQAQGKGVKPTVGGMKELDLAGRSQTETQELEREDA